VGRRKVRCQAVAVVFPRHDHLDRVGVYASQSGSHGRNLCLPDIVVVEIHWRFAAHPGNGHNVAGMIAAHPRHAVFECDRFGGRCHHHDRDLVRTLTGSSN
jgi:hypothetical protein